MNYTVKIILLGCMSILLTACISKKEYAKIQTQLADANKNLDEYGETVNDYMTKLSACERNAEKLKGQVKSAKGNLKLREEQIKDLKDQVSDVRTQRDKQFNQVDDLTVLTQEANQNIEKTLSQLERKDKYIQYIQEAKTKADSMNLALAVNLKSVLEDGISDADVQVEVDKTVVFVNLSDKMLFHSGSSIVTQRADEVLGKIAKIIQSRPTLEVMVEGYTDNVQISRPCMEDNWDLSVKRATAVVRKLHKEHNVNPNRLIAAGRGEYNSLTLNDTEAGRAMNRRTRIIILPKLDEFYELLDPNNVPK